MLDNYLFTIAYCLHPTDHDSHEAMVKFYFPSLTLSMTLHPRYSASLLCFIQSYSLTSEN
jgi:hypothetical protein